MFKNGFESFGSVVAKLNGAGSISITTISNLSSILKPFYNTGMYENVPFEKFCLCTSLFKIIQKT